jgi:hypothetical protein
MTYAILNTAHPDYPVTIQSLGNYFTSVLHGSIFTPILNIAKTQCLVEDHIGLILGGCVLQVGGNEVPASRKMIEWELPMKP